MRLLDDIRMDVKVSENQSKLFTMQHVRYDVQLEYRNLKLNIPYQCNKSYFVTLEDVIYSVIADSLAYKESRDVLGFCLDYGYDDEETARRTYNDCLKESNWLDFCFTHDEVDELMDLLMN